MFKFLKDKLKDAVKKFSKDVEEEAEDIEESEDMAEIFGAPDAFLEISTVLEQAGITPEEAGLVRIPENTVEIKDIETARKILRLVEKLEDQDDVQRRGRGRRRQHDAPLRTVSRRRPRG